MEIKKSKDMPWDEQKVGIRNGWAIGQAVQMSRYLETMVTPEVLVRLENKVEFTELLKSQNSATKGSIKQWTQWFLQYAEELRDEQADAYNASHAQYKPVLGDIKPRYIPEGVSQGKMQGTVYTPPKAKQ